MKQLFMNAFGHSPENLTASQLIFLIAFSRQVLKDKNIRETINSLFNEERITKLISEHNIEIDPIKLPDHL